MLLGVSFINVFGTEKLARLLAMWNAKNLFIYSNYLRQTIAIEWSLHTCSSIAINQQSSVWAKKEWNFYLETSFPFSGFPCRERSSEDIFYLSQQSPNKFISAFHLTLHFFPTCLLLLPFLFLFLLPQIKGIIFLVGFGWLDRIKEPVSQDWVKVSHTTATSYQPGLRREEENCNFRSSMSFFSLPLEFTFCLGRCPPTNKPTNRDLLLGRATMPRQKNWSPVIIDLCSMRKNNNCLLNPFSVMFSLNTHIVLFRLPQGRAHIRHSQVQERQYQFFSGIFPSSLHLLLLLCNGTQFLHFAAAAIAAANAAAPPQHKHLLV